MTYIKDISEIINSKDINEHIKVDCLKIPIDSKYFIYNPKTKTVNENFEAIKNNNIDFDYYIITHENENLQYQQSLFNDMEKYSNIKFELSDKMIDADKYINNYIDFQRLCIIMSKEDYLNLSDPKINEKYKDKYIIIHDEIPHLDNLDLIQTLGYEIDCVHLNANSKYFILNNEKNELDENDELIYNDRRKIFSYIIDINKNEFDNEHLLFNYGDRFKDINVYV